MEKGNLAKWHVKEGDKVAAGDVIAEIETDKATMEVEAVDEGTLGKILVAEGTEDVPVNERIALILGEGEDAGALEDAASPAPAKAEVPKIEEKAEPTPPVPAPATTGNGVDRGKGGRIFASPLARRMAAQKGIDLSSLSGSGPRGRIVARDIEQAPAETARPAAAPAAEARSAPAQAPAPSGPGAKDVYAPDSYRELPHDGMRRTIARRLTESKQTVPHFYLTIECELDAVLKLRRELNEQAPRDGEGDPAYRLSVNDFLIKALALALQKVPMANASWTEEARLIHQHSDVGVAVAIPDGLFTPVIRRAEEKTLSAISAEMKDLASRARDKKLKPEEYQGGSTALSNLGMYGIREFSAVINPPQGTILAVGAGRETPIVKSGRIVVANVMSATLSCDHRVVDGALGAELLAAFKELMEHPVRLLV
jgi:pyruvate dehydrogenase E2 component (dihydrolipoamide acetyltransferase)